MTPQRRRRDATDLGWYITEAAARRQPSVLLFEDAHWADPTTLEVFGIC